MHEGIATVVELLPQARVLPALGVALALGLRHAADPDHVTAVATLAVGERPGMRSAASLGLAWGAGHALTLVLLGLPVVLADAHLPQELQRAAEAGVGLLIVALGARLLLRWRRGELHVHDHGPGVRPRARARTPLAAFGVGLVHGVGGSAAAGVLVVASIGRRDDAVLALVLFAAGTAAAMACASAALGLSLTRGPLARRAHRLAPAVGVAGVAFGAWYALGALATAPAAL